LQKINYLLNNRLKKKSIYTFFVCPI